MGPVGIGTAVEHVVTEAARLLEILQREHSALMGRDTAAIEQITHEKQQQIARLEESSRQQTSSLHSAGYTEGSIKADSWIKQHHRELLPSWQKLQTLLSRCKQQNQINGGIIEANRRHTQLALGVLLGKPQETQTYGAGGCTTGIGYSRSIAKA
jgi:flagellar biosynthesis/type III secretory pathway chaperone